MISNKMKFFEYHSPGWNFINIEKKYFSSGYTSSIYKVLKGIAESDARISKQTKRKKKKKKRKNIFYPILLNEFI